MKPSRFMDTEIIHQNFFAGKAKTYIAGGPDTNATRNELDLTIWDVLIISCSVSLIAGLLSFVLSLFPQSTRGEYTCTQFKRDAEINPQLYTNTFMIDIVQRCQDSL